MSKRKVMKLASRGKRFGAACIDMIIPLTSCIISLIAFIVMLAGEFAGNPYYGYGLDPGFGLGYGYGYNSGPSAGVIITFLISLIISTVFLVIQLVMFNKSRTLGKAALGLQVVSSKDGEPIGFWMMLFREFFVKQASGCVFLLGFIWILIDDKNRGWHDKVLDTYVVDLNASAALSSEHRAKKETSEKVSPYRTEEAPAAAEKPTPKSAPIPMPAVERREALAERPAVIELSGDIAPETVSATEESVDTTPETVSAKEETVDTTPETVDAAEDAVDIAPEIVNATEGAGDELPGITDAESADEQDEEQ